MGLDREVGGGGGIYMYEKEADRCSRMDGTHRMENHNLKASSEFSNQSDALIHTHRPTPIYKRCTYICVYIHIYVCTSYLRCKL